VTLWTAPDADRHRPPGVADERQMLRGFVDYQRQTLLGKCQGLTSEQLSSAAVPPSALTLVGLLRHLRASALGRTLSLRWVYLHMIEEYARHNGHADLIRERIDGVTGE
jgi:Protein of unknown function (DUF664)